MSSDDESPRKKAKPSGDGNDDEGEGAVRILIFCPDQAKNVKLELLSTHTIYDLISTLCEHVSIGSNDDEGPDCHMWLVRCKDGREYESGEHECRSDLRANRTTLDELVGLSSSSSLEFEYDYGVGIRHKIHFLNEEELVVGGEGRTREEALSLYPRRKPTQLPGGYARYEPPADANNNNVVVDLDELFPELRTWIFDSHSVTLHFFQPGRKQNNCGFFDSSGNKMMFLPVKPDNLTNYLGYFNRGASCVSKGMEEGGDGYMHYTWHSVVVLPASKMTAALSNKYESHTEEGFTDCVRARDAPSDTLGRIFPKISALAGWKKDAYVPKGWMTFVKKGDACSITICTGKTINHKNNAPKGTAYDGYKQHDPEADPLIDVGGIEIKGLQDLFCVVEGLLRARG